MRSYVNFYFGILTIYKQILLKTPRLIGIMNTWNFLANYARGRDRDLLKSKTIILNLSKTNLVGMSSELAMDWGQITN